MCLKLLNEKKNNNDNALLINIQEHYLILPILTVLWGWVLCLAGQAESS